MRVFSSILTIILLVIGVVGLGLGMLAVALAGKLAGATGVVAALMHGVPPFLLGTVALGAAAIVIAIEQASADQVTAINRGTEVAINEAKIAQHQRESR